METDKVKFIRNLHLSVDEFISSVRNYFSPEILMDLDIYKIYAEIMKRRESIRQELRNISISKTCLESKELSAYDMTVLPELKDRFNKRINDLVKSVFSQDLVEIALSDKCCIGITDRDLHDALFSGAVKDVTSYTSPLLEMEEMFSFGTPFFAFQQTSNSEILTTSLNRLQLSSQFEDARMQLDDEIMRMAKFGQNSYSVPKLKLTYENVISQKSTSKSGKKCLLDTTKSMNNWLDEIDFLYSKIYPSDVNPLTDSNFREINHFPNREYRSWENCLGHTSVRNHSYISELCLEEARLSISGEEYDAYNSLVTRSDAISETDLLHDILNVLIGLQSDTFYFDIPARRFRMKPSVHLPNLSFKCSANIVDKYLDAANMYHALCNFCDFRRGNKGSVFKGMQKGVREILSVYEKYILAVKSNSPIMVFNSGDVMHNAELIESFGVICGIDPEKMIITEIPKGLGLLSYLHEMACSHKRFEHGIMIAVLIKYAYEPYVSFLNKWMTEGICEDPQHEFQIVEDKNYLGRYDSWFWKFAYTENIDDSFRAVPPELRDFSQGILDCGKSIKLLKNLNSHDSEEMLSTFLKPFPFLENTYFIALNNSNRKKDGDVQISSDEFASLNFFSPKPPPSLSMVFSFQAAMSKAKECMDYITFLKNENSEPVHKISGMDDDVSVDKFYLESQRLVNKIQMTTLVKRRYDLICAGEAAKSNILDVKEVFCYLKQHQTNYPYENIIRGSMLRNTDFPIEAKTYIYRKDNFSGKLYDNIGVLFSSCGYVENNMASDLSLKDTHFSFPSIDFSKQLSLSSYSNFSSPADSIWDKFTFREYWNSFWYDNMVLKNLNCTRNRFCNILSEKTADIHMASNVYSFMDKLALLLVSEYGDSIDDIYSCIKVISLQRLMVHIFHHVLNTRMYVVEKAIMKCIVKAHRLDSVLCVLRNIYFLQDGTFSQSLCEPIFSLIMESKTPAEFANFEYISKILANALSDSDFEYNLLTLVVSGNDFLCQDIALERLDWLHLLTIECHIEWPLNIIVHQACIQQYKRVFKMLLEIEFLCWLLGRTWRHLVSTCKKFSLDDIPQFRAIMLNRFEMDQFIRVIRNSIHEHLQGPIWKNLEKSLSADRSSIDNLENVHMKYLEKVLARCFLTDETNALHILLLQMFNHVYSICNAVCHCEWQKNESTGVYETYIFEGLNETFQNFKLLKKEFLILWLQNTVMVDRHEEGVINKKMWTLLGQRLSGFPADHSRDRQRHFKKDRHV